MILLSGLVSEMCAITKNATERKKRGVNQTHSLESNVTVCIVQMNLVIVILKNKTVGTSLY